MFDVLVYLYENYWRPDACPELPQLSRKLSAVGFEQEEIEDALKWLHGLALHAQASGVLDAEPGDEPPQTILCQSATPAPAEEASIPSVLGAAQSSSMRVYLQHEQEHLGSEGLGFLLFLETAGALTPVLRELVMDRAMAVDETSPIPLDELKIIVLMVFWSLGQQPNPLILDELSFNDDERVLH